MHTPETTDNRHSRLFEYLRQKDAAKRVSPRAKQLQERTLTAEEIARFQADALQSFRPAEHLVSDL